MLLQQSVNDLFIQLRATLEQLSSSQYNQPCKILFNNTIGQHVRHIIEIFQCLESGYDEGIVNYEKRKRDLEIETDKSLADRLLLEIYEQLNRPNKDLQLEASYDDHAMKPALIATNYYREVAYNLEHTVHHMAMIRVGISEVGPISVSDNFGVASSTIKHHRQCAR